MRLRSSWDIAACCESSFCFVLASLVSSDCEPNCSSPSPTSLPSNPSSSLLTTAGRSWPNATASPSGLNTAPLALLSSSSVNSSGLGVNACTPSPSNVEDCVFSISDSAVCALELFRSPCSFFNSLSSALRASASLFKSLRILSSKKVSAPILFLNSI